MPQPHSRYCEPLASGVAPSFQKRNSAACVPLLSPRETKVALAAATLASACTMSAPLTRAGSAAGPISTKSLYITGKRLRAKPSATNFSSATWSWTNKMSASPRRPMSMACPVPSATTLTSTPVALVKAGSRCPNNPDCSVDVVEAITMLFWAWAVPRAHSSSAAARPRDTVFFMQVLL